MQTSGKCAFFTLTVVSNRFIHGPVASLLETEECVDQDVGSCDAEQGVPSVEIIIRERGGEARRADADHADRGRLGQTRDKDTNVPENSATFEPWAQRQLYEVFCGVLHQLGANFLESQGSLKTVQTCWRPGGVGGHQEPGATPQDPPTLVNRLAGT